jgi:hypothetical protein
MKRAIAKNGNSGNGRSLTNKEKHLNVNYYEENNVGLAVNDPHFRKLDIIEVSKTKTSIKMNLPMQI